MQRNQRLPNSQASFLVQLAQNNQIHISFFESVDLSFGPVKL